MSALWDGPRDYVEMGQMQAEWEEATGRVDHGLWSRGRITGWHGRLTEDDERDD